MDLKKVFSKYSVIVLLISNLYIVAGALIFGWNIFNIIIIYVVETFIIGFFNVFRMIFARQTIFTIDREPSAEPSFFASHGMKFFMVPFFIVHYNAFVGIQFLFVFIFSQLGGGFFGTTDAAFDFYSIIDLFRVRLFTGILIIFISHAFSFFYNYMHKKEYMKADVGVLMFTPYKRIVIQQVVVLGGAVLLAVFNTPVVFLFVLIALKIFFDLKSHLKAHKT